MKTSLLDRIVVSLFQTRNRRLTAIGKKFRSALGTVILAVATGLSGDVYATDYIVDATATPGGNTYNTLEELRTGVATGWQNGDTITLRGNDNSLTGNFDFGNGNDITIKGYGVLSPSTPGNRFESQNQSRTITIQADPDQTLKFTGFGSDALLGGVFLNENGTLQLGSTGGIIEFSENKGSRGGSVNVSLIEIVGGVNNFLKNSAKEHGGL